MDIFGNEIHLNQVEQEVTGLPPVMSFDELSVDLLSEDIAEGEKRLSQLAEKQADYDNLSHQERSTVPIEMFRTGMRQSVIKRLAGEVAIRSSAELIDDIEAFLKKAK